MAMKNHWLILLIFVLNFLLLPNLIDRGWSDGAKPEELFICVDVPSSDNTTRKFKAKNVGGTVYAKSQFF